MSLGEIKSIKEIKSVKIRLFSPEEILKESHGEVKSPETINYRTQRAERDGLFCEKIFGPEKDYRCYCGKYKGIKYKGVVCDRCGVEVTTSRVRRERHGHISLATPVLHIWFLKIVPSTISLLLNVSEFDLEKVVYFAGYIIEEVDEERKKEIEKEIEKEFKEKAERLKKEIEDKFLLKEAIADLENKKNKAKSELKMIQPLKVLNEIEFRELSLKYGDCFKAGTGAETLKRIVQKIDLDKEIKKMEKELEKGDPETKKKLLMRLKLFKCLKRENTDPSWIFLENLLVLPPELRPIVQLEEARYASSDLNELYKRVINRNNRLKQLMAIGAPEVILRNEKRLLQEAVDALLDNTLRKSITTKATTGGRRLLKSLADILKGKEGRFRLNLLGKRVDYSGRSVIIVGPDLKVDQVGIPKRMALEIFRPFVIKALLDKKFAFNVKAASRLIDEEREEVYECLEEVIKDKVVLINRAPTLHRLSILAFYPKLIEGRAIKIHPLVCEPFNADFDGDQMAVYLPLSSKAQEESKERMLYSKNVLKPASGELTMSLGQEVSLGIKLLTQIREGEKGEGKVFSSFEEAKMAAELGYCSLGAKIKVKTQKGELIETSVGRIVFNEVIKDYFDFQNYEIKDKNELKRILFEIYQKAGPEKTKEILDKVKEVAFEYGTSFGVSFGIEDLKIPPQKKELVEKAQKEEEKLKKAYEKGLFTEEEYKKQKNTLWLDAIYKISKFVPETLGQLNPVSLLIESKAKGSWNQVNQMCALKGLVSSPSGEIIDLPVIHSYKEGLSPLEYFISTHGARKGSTDKALRTSFAGYLTRRLVDAAHDVIVREKDCGDKEGLEVDLKDAQEIGQKFEFKIVGRMLAKNVIFNKKILFKKGEVIDWKKAQEIVKKGIEKVTVFSPLTCKTKPGVCQKCYGWDLGKNEMVKLGEAVGIVAAQSIGEPGTQLTMRTFHLGGIAIAQDITQGLPRVEEVFEAMTPKLKGEICPVNGKVIEAKAQKIKILDSETKKEIEIVLPPNVHCFVKKGDKVKKGQILSEGPLDPKEMLKYYDPKEVLKYMLKEIQKVYCQNGVVIHDKHIEIILKQMFSRVKIIDPGDSTFLLGEVVEEWRFEEENKMLRKKNKKEAKAKKILLGITKVALTYSSFLSAASFQETARVLTRAALEQRKDYLLGLKENVILGKLLPIGDEFKPQKEDEEK